MGRRARTHESENTTNEETAWLTPHVAARMTLGLTLLFRNHPLVTQFRTFAMKRIDEKRDENGAKSDDEHRVW
jgi:hypothetical protein